MNTAKKAKELLKRHCESMIELGLPMSSVNDFWDETFDEIKKELHERRRNESKTKKM